MTTRLLVRVTSAVRKVSQCGATLAAAVPLILMVYIPGISPAAAVSMMMVSYGLNSLQYSGFHVNHVSVRA
jgi:sterol desaturase/sphingolipid hydroxylase (fatty acid hydroxylase superfamily)